MTDTFVSQAWLFWLYLGAGALAFASAGLLMAAAIRIRDLLAVWLALLLLSVALDFYAKSVLRSPNPQITLELAFGILRFAAAGCVMTIIGVTDCWFSQHNGHLDGIRRLMYWWRIFKGREGMEKQPVVTAATLHTLLVVLGNALVAWLSAMGIVQWDDAQKAATNGLIVALVNVAAIVGPAWWAKGKTAALADPRDEDGAPLSRSDNSPTIAQVRSARIK